jgi:Gamma-glutamyl cyclotransferase, AIG2-like
LSAPILGHVFGYGSLVAQPGVRPASLSGHRRVWGVAMDNRVAVPGYKVYALPDGTRPKASIAFLDLAAAGEDPAAPPVNGALLPVDAATLAALDARERQYERIEITPLITPRPTDPLPIWTYVGRPPGRARAAAGHAATATVLIQRAYLLLVETAFATHGPATLAAYRASTEPPPFPIVDLTRIDLPADG